MFQHQYAAKGLSAKGHRKKLCRYSGCLGIRLICLSHCAAGMRTMFTENTTGTNFLRNCFVLKSGAGSHVKYTEGLRERDSTFRDLYTVVSSSCDVLRESHFGGVTRQICWRMLDVGWCVCCVDRQRVSQAGFALVLLGFYQTFCTECILLCRRFQRCE